MTSHADFKRRVRERMARTGESYTTARAHLLKPLHVTNGDSTVMTLRELGVEALPWRDALHEGPVLPGRTDLRAAALGAPVFACTPDAFPDMLAAALEGRDVNAWAADAGISVA